MTNGTGPGPTGHGIIGSVAAWLGHMRRIADYRLRFGRMPRLRPPVGYNERILHRVFHDHDPKLVIASDKLATKDFVRDRIGARYVVPLLGAWARAEDIDWRALPEHFVLKPNQGSGRMRIIREPADRDTAWLTELAREWLRDKPFPEFYREWGYRHVPKRVIAEPLLLGPDGAQADEWDVYVFEGRAKIFRKMMGRKLTPDRHDAWFDHTGRQIAISVRRIRSAPAELPAPLRTELAALAERLGAGFSSLRVDFYDTPEGLKVGELTPYSWGGRCEWADPWFDEAMGALWRPDVDGSIFADFEAPRG